MDYPLLVAFTIGLVSTLHCLGMCSGIIGALSMSLPTEIHQNKARLFPYVLAYSAGRVGSYTLAGALMGGVSAGLFQGLSPSYGNAILQTIATLMLLSIGLYLAGWFPKLARVERLGQPLWRRLEPVGRRLMPVSSIPQAFLFGAVWGWLPCGLVYSTLIWAASSGGALDTALLMAAFGLGTLPTVVAAGMIVGWMAKFSRMENLRKMVGIILIIMAFIPPVYTLLVADHEHRLPMREMQH